MKGNINVNLKSVVGEKTTFPDIVSLTKINQSEAANMPQHAVVYAPVFPIPPFHAFPDDVSGHT